MQVHKIIQSLRADLAALDRAQVPAPKASAADEAMEPRPVRPLDAGEIRQLRKTLGLSQPSLADHLNITAATVARWERGDTQPSGPALRLLNLIADRGLQALA